LRNINYANKLRKQREKLNKTFMTNILSSSPHMLI